MAGHALAAMEDFHSRLGHPQIDQLPDQAERHGIPAALCFNVIIRRDACAFPTGKDIWFGRQWSQVRSVQRRKEIGAAGPVIPHHPHVQIIQQGPDGRVQLCQREEPPVPQPRDNPALRHLNRHLSLCFVFWLVRSCGQDRRAVMPSHLSIGSVQTRIMAIGPDHSGLQIVRNHSFGHAAKVAEHTRMRADPVFQPLRGNRFGIGIARRAHGRDEQLRAMHLTSRWINDVDGIPREVDKDLLAAQMGLPHAWAHAPLPGVKMRAEPRVAKATRVLRTVLLPKQHPGDPALAQLLVDHRPVGSRAVRVQHSRRRREQQQLQAVVIQPLRQRPVQTRVTGAAQIRTNAPLPKPERRGDRPLAQPVGKLQSQYIPYPAHGQTSCRHSAPPFESEG